MKSNRDSNGMFVKGHEKIGNAGAPKGIHNSPKTEFIKGQTSWNKGLKGWNLNHKTSFKKGMTPHNAGIDNRYTHTCETCGKITKDYHKIKKYCSRKCMYVNPEFLKRKSEARKGKSATWFIGKPKEYMKGEKNINWNGGTSKLSRKLRLCEHYVKWRNAVYERDNWTCRTCETRGGKLEPHHIKSFAKMLKEFNIKTSEEAWACSELWDINNGVTLCLDCHKLTDNYQGKGRR